MTLNICVLFLAQMVAGASVMLGSMLVLLQSIDEHSSLPARVFWILLFVSGAWLGLDPLLVGHVTTTTPGLIFSGCVAWALLRHRKIVRNAVEYGKQRRPADSSGACL